MTNFPKRLKQIRQSKRATQKSVANYLEIREQAYQMYEYGKREPDYETLMKLSEYFNVPSDYLLGIGLFSNWNEISEHWEAVINEVYNELEKMPFPPNEGKIALMVKNDKALALQVLNKVLKKIEINDETETITIDWKV